MDLNLQTADFVFRIRTNTRFGVGKALLLGKMLKEMNFSKIGVIIDGNVSQTDYGKKIIESLQKEDFSEVIIWEYDLGGEPDYDSLDRIKMKFIKAESEPLVDCFVGIGGGSVIDFAKGMATLTVNPGKALEYRGFPTGLTLPLPTIAIPTTAGTGSDVTYNAVFNDNAGKKKLGINILDNFPRLAVLDPQLIAGAPKSVLISSGMDALVHTLESYTATKANPLTRMFAREAFKYIFNNLPRLVKNPDDIELASRLQLGAYLGATSLMNSGSGIAGGLSYILGVHYKVPHGIAGGVFISHIMKYNVEKGYDYSDLYDLIDGVDKSKANSDKSKEFVDKLFEMANIIGIPNKLNKFGVNKDNIETLLKDCENLGGAFAQNPIEFSVEDGKKLLLEMIED